MDNDFTPVVGKDVIESLTIGMYEDSRFIFREYIQNSADQIDMAIREGILTKRDGEIHINIDSDKREIIIEDNATGIQQSLVQPILQNIAQSTKIRGIDKGFRGIGRLGGLAYCDKLIFETSYKGEKFKSTLVWDATLLKEILNNRTVKQDAISVIKEVTTINTESELEDSHYFKVIMQKVSNDALLNKGEIEKYLSMVAPVPFPTRFIYKSKIYEELTRDCITLDEYKIYLNTDQLFKGYTTTIYKGDEVTRKKEDEVIDVNFFKAYANDGQLLYWGWHSISEKNQSLNQINYTRGFRLRKANIQVGDDFTLLKLQRDKRFHNYYFGEVYGIHPDLIPNSRRDYFTENNIYFEFEHKLKEFFHTTIYKLSYQASEINSSLKKIEDLKTFSIEYEQKQSNGFTDKKEHQEYVNRFEKKKEEALKAQKKIEILGQNNGDSTSITVNKILKRAISNNSATTINAFDLPIDNNQKLKYRTENLSSLNKDQRKLVSKIFTVIRDVLDKNTAESLIQKIEEELK